MTEFQTNNRRLTDDRCQIRLSGSLDSLAGSCRNSHESCCKSTPYVRFHGVKQATDLHNAAPIESTTYSGVIDGAKRLMAIAMTAACVACGGGGDGGSSTATTSAPSTPSASVPAPPASIIPTAVFQAIAKEAGAQEGAVRTYAAANGWDAAYTAYRAKYAEAADPFYAMTGDVSSQRLGEFYIVRHVPNVPQCNLPLGTEYANSPTARAMCALSRWADGNTAYLVTVADQFIAEQVNGQIQWMAPLEPAYGITKAPYISSLTQGVVTSVLLRAYQNSGQQKYLDAAQDTYRWIVAPVSQGGTLDTHIGTWFEQLPTQVPGAESGHILNGHMSALLGIYDYYRVTGDANAKAMFDAGAAAIKANMAWYDVGYWSVYSHLNREDMITAHYAQLSAQELLALGRITGDQWFTDAGNRWAAYLENDTLFVHNMALTYGR